MKQHYEHSSYRERLLEHLFISELLKLSWQRGVYSLEISKPEVDRSGYDFVAEANGYIRHIQLKTTFIGSRSSHQKVQPSLGSKPSGCVIIIQFDKDTLRLGPFLYFGAAPGERLPPLDSYKVAKHTKANAQGIKSLRPNLREVPNSAFQKVGTIEELYQRLFGIN